jgi:hypothetical protein
LIYRRATSQPRIFLILIASLGIVLVSYLNFLFVKANPGGKDFLVQWVGSKMLIVNEVSPYIEESHNAIMQTAEIQGISAHEDDLRFHYPLYSIIVFFPFALIPDYLFARAIWMTVLELSVLGSIWLFQNLFDIKPNNYLTILFLILFAFGFHGVFPMVNGDVIVLIGLFIVASLIMIKNGEDEIAGVLLAFTTIQGQSLIVFYVFLLYWVIRNHRWNIALWFLITIILLSASSLLFIPSWILEYLRLTIQYPAYAPFSTPGRALAALWFPLFGIRIGWILSGLLVLILLLEWRNAGSRSFRIFLWLVSLSILCSQWIGIPSEPSNYLLIYIGLALISTNMAGRWGIMASVYTAVAIGFIFLGIWLIYLNTIEFYQINYALHPIFVFPLPIVTFLGLYWIRWWIFHQGETENINNLYDA